MTSRELYNAAYSSYENKEYDKLLELCSTILVMYPDSKEAKWAIKNFPIIWNKEQQIVQLKDIRTYQQKQNKRGTFWLASFIIAIFFIGIFQIFGSQGGEGALAATPFILIIMAFLAILILSIVCGKKVVKSEIKHSEKSDIIYLKQAYEKGKCPGCGEDIDKNLTKCFSCGFDFYESGLMK